MGAGTCGPFSRTPCRVTGTAAHRSCMDDDITKRKPLVCLAVCLAAAPLSRLGCLIGHLRSICVGAAVVSMVFRMPAIAISLLALLIQAQAAKLPTFFKTPLTVQEMTNKQAVVNTSAGTFVIDLRPDVAPNHVGYFMKLAKEGAYNGTIFHRVIKYGIVQGGDPLSKDPAKAKLYGTGGLGVLKAELNAEKETRGAVSAVIQPGKPDSAGAQFFVCVTDQAALDG